MTEADASLLVIVSYAASFFGLGFSIGAWLGTWMGMRK